MLTSPMSMDNRHDILKDIPVLLPQGGDHGQDSFRKNGAVIALVGEASLPLQDRAAQGSLGQGDLAGLIMALDSKEPSYLSDSPGSHRIGPMPLGERLKISSSGAPSRVDAEYSRQENSESRTETMGILPGRRGPQNHFWAALAKPAA